MNLQKEPELYNIQPSPLSLFPQNSSSIKLGNVFQNSNSSNNFLPKPEDTRAYQELYPGFIEKMISAFEAESEHRRSLEKESSAHKKLMSEKLVESQILNQIKNIEIETKEQKHQHTKFYIALIIGLSVFFSSYWLNMENKSAFIGLYILLAVLGLSPKNFFLKKDKIDIQKNNKP